MTRLISFSETVQCNFKGPFKYDIVDHVRKAQRETINSVLRKEYVGIKAPGGQQESVPKETSTPTVLADKASKAKTAQKATTAPASPQKVVRNIDGALAPAVLSYLQHSGFLGSAAAMRKDMGCRKRLLDTGLGEGDDSRMKKVAKIENWYEAQETSWRQLHKIKADYAENRLSSVWHDLRDGPSPSVGFTHFLETEHGLWTCRLRIRYFYKALLQNLRQGESEIASTKETLISLPELFSDADFKTFLLGETSSLPEAQGQLECEASSALLALGNRLRVEHGNSPNPVIKRAVETALSYMSYNDISEFPRDVYSHMSQVGLAEEAEELVKAIRSELVLFLGLSHTSDSNASNSEHQGKPTSSALEAAFASTNSVLSDLGRLHSVASAGFLSVEEINKARV